MIATDIPFRQYLDKSGLALDGGYLYFGLPNQNPETAPITVYWDEAGTLPASQPIRTINGFAVRNGNIANVFSSAEYSITIRNAKRELVSYSPTSSAFDAVVALSASTGSGLIGYPRGVTATNVGSALDILYYGIANVKSPEYAGGASDDGVTDAYPAVAAALASGKKIVFLPEPATFYRMSAGIVVPDGVTLCGASMIPANQGGTPGGTVLKFDNAVATCLTLGTANNTTANARDLVIWRAGTPPAGSTGIFCDRVNNPQLCNVAVVNHARLYRFFASGSAGLGGAMVNCYGSDCTENYFHLDGWPELRVTGGRMGRIGSGEAAGQAFVYVTATGSAGAGMGPNTINFVNTQFNQGTAGPSYLVMFDAVNIAQGNQVIYNFSTCHVENVTTGYIKTTSTALYLQKLTFDGACTLNTPVPLFTIDPATQINECHINCFVAGSVTLATSALINRLFFTGAEISGAASFTGNASFGNNMFISNTVFNGALTLAGAWSHLAVKASVSGAVTNTAVQFNTASQIDIDIPGVLSRINDLIRYDTYGGTGPQIYMRSARGSSGAPTISQAGDGLAHVRAWSHDGSVFGQSGLVRCINSGGAPALGSTPGAWVISTTSVGALTTTDRWTFRADGALAPISDNAYSLGASGARPSVIWAATGAISTSDEHTKTDIADSVLGLDFIKSLRPVSYRFKVGGNEVIRQVYLDEDGNEIPEGEPIPDDAKPGRIITREIPGTRTHWGLIAQEVKALTDPLGVDFAGHVLADKDDPDSEQGLRYEEFIGPLIKAVQQLSARVEQLESK